MVNICEIYGFQLEKLHIFYGYIVIAIAMLWFQLNDLQANIMKILRNMFICGWSK